MITVPPPESGNDRVLSLIDRLVEPADQGLRTLFRVHQSTRSYPADGIDDTVDQPATRRKVISLMRINHSGEVAAQALYQGQALVARNPVLRESLLEAGREEADHLAWCSQRIGELGGRTSLFDPLWYAGSFAIGALAGLAGDRTSLGFVAETERQVVEHLEGHLAELPHDDRRTREIVNQMSADEARHGHNAMQAGGAALPPLTRALMKLTAGVMTRTARWI
ncbi:2-polyprenyl-3-methyl-6-methoxy-1,4-benzoquinone monooxygenase [Povalibacter sp.]|uniref:2-polyprenyl-3-methyl-6-methoxy-1,4-benzoquinone monooxygenase n=1 Tax=Povalibacter sp. TaxID=1962978 RepID=UPI002F413773